MDKDLGGTTWVFSAGFAPSGSTGQEPEFTSRNTLCLLNTGERQACVQLTFYYEDAAPVGPYEVLVEPQRVKHQRINDLIEPEAVPLDAAYGWWWSRTVLWWPSSTTWTAAGES